jgi:hypothetical protein
VLMTNKFKGRKFHFGRASVSVPVQKAKAPCLIDLICSLNRSLQMLITRDPGSCEIATTALKNSFQLLSRLVRFLHDQNVSVDGPDSKNNLSESGN